MSAKRLGANKQQQKRASLRGRRFSVLGFLSYFHGKLSRELYLPRDFRSFAAYDSSSRVRHSCINLRVKPYTEDLWKIIPRLDLHIARSATREF